MLGEKRSPSLFVPVQESLSMEAPEPAAEPLPLAPSRERIKTEKEQAPPALLQPEPPPKQMEQAPDSGGAALSSGPRTDALFFVSDDGVHEFPEVLREVQEFIATEHSGLITTGDPLEAREQIKRYISKYVLDRRLSVKGMSQEALTGALCTEMAEFGFLTKYIYHSEGVEEININAWDDVEVLYASGNYEKLAESFDSPEHAVNVVRRMLHMSGAVLDNASPVMQGSLGKNIRLAVMKHPIVDEDVGIAGSIRIVNQLKLTREDFIAGGTATEEMLDFLAACLRYGASTCMAGATGSGKTTLAGWLLSTLPDSKRIITIEDGSRELDLVKRGPDGRPLNRIIHMITRPSENPGQNIDQTDLIEITLRYHPDVVAIAEMRSEEANAAIEMALAGHTTLTTIHSNSCESTYRRMVTLCKRGSTIDDGTLLSFATEAFPIVVYSKQLENKERKIMEIQECVPLRDGSREYRPLYRYNVISNRMESGKLIIEGLHERVNEPSELLQKRLMENGMAIQSLKRLIN